MEDKSIHYTIESLRDFLDDFNDMKRFQQRRLAIGIEIIEYTGSKLGLSDEDKEQAIIILKKLEKDSFTRYSSPIIYPLVCVFIICQKKRYPISMADLSYLVRENKNNLINNLKKLKINYSEFKFSFVPFPYFVKRLSKDLNLEKSIQTILFEIALKLHQQKSLPSQGKDPLAFAAALIYHYSSITPRIKWVSQETLADLAFTTPVTIRNNLRRIESCIDKEFWELYIETKYLEINNEMNKRRL